LNGKYDVPMDVVLKAVADMVLARRLSGEFDYKHDLVFHKLEDGRLYFEVKEKEKPSLY
jgi:hypothetical protein